MKQTICVGCGLPDCNGCYTPEMERERAKTQLTHKDTLTIINPPTHTKNEIPRYIARRRQVSKEILQQSTHMRSSFKDWRTKLNIKQQTTSVIRRMIADRSHYGKISFAFGAWKHWTTQNKCIRRAALRMQFVLQMMVNRVTAFKDTAFNIWKSWAHHGKYIRTRFATWTKWVCLAGKKKAKEFFRNAFNDGITRTNKTLITRTMVG